jgi:hypothetical protein
MTKEKVLELACILVAGKYANSAKYEADCDEDDYLEWCVADVIDQARKMEIVITDY